MSIIVTINVTLLIIIMRKINHMLNLLTVHKHYLDILDMCCIALDENYMRIVTYIDILPNP